MYFSLLLIPEVFVTAQTTLYHCTIASYHCTYCASLHRILGPGFNRLDTIPACDSQPANPPSQPASQPRCRSKYRSMLRVARVKIDILVTALFATTLKVVSATGHLSWTSVLKNTPYIAYRWHIAHAQMLRTVCQRQQSFLFYRGMADYVCMLICACNV